MGYTPYTTDNFVSLKPNYPFDPTANVKNYTFFSDENVNFNFSQVLSGAADCKVNNFSKLFLTGKKKLSDFFVTQPLLPTLVSFSTFFAFDALEGTTPKSFYWRVDESNDTVDSPQVFLTTHVEQVNKLSNDNFFDIIFISPMLCKISHEHNGILRYLSVDYTFNLSFTTDIGLDRLEQDSPQIFHYFYDKNSDLIIFYKKILDFPYYITYNPYTGHIALRQPPEGPFSPFNLNGVMRVRPHAVPVDSYLVDEVEVSYGKNFISSLDSVSAKIVQNNFLVNAEFQNITGDTVDVNILSLKNELTPQNNNAFSNDYFVTAKYNYRDYGKIFSGTPQIFGDDNISLSYSGWSTPITFKAGVITYFHIPGNIYPYTQLNINDANFHKFGAIASDHPVKSDKIFKKHGAYKNTTPFGAATDEGSGVFVCSWLSAGADVNQKPLWVDRYYNPQKTTFIEALTGSTINPYTPHFDTVIASVSSTATIFDKPSDLYFEPGVYYAYHHIGTSDMQSYLSILDQYAVQKGLVNYYSSDTQFYGRVEDVGEYVFDGKQYSSTVSLSSILTNNRFTVSFDLKAADWQVPFANQIIGNYLNTGFGIFNEQYITPYLHFFTGKTLYVYSSLGQLIDTVVCSDQISNVIRLEGIRNYYIVLNNGKIKEYTAANTLVNEADAPVFTNTVRNCFFTSTSAAILTDGVSGNHAFIFDYKTNSISETTNIVTPLNTPLSACYSITLSGDTTYCVPAAITHCIDSTIYFLSGNSEIKSWGMGDTAVYPFFQTSIPIRDFNIDKDNNFWVVTDHNIYIYTQNRQRVTIISLSANTGIPVSIDFVNEITPAGQQYYGVLALQSLTVGGKPVVTIQKYTVDGISLGSFDTQPDFGYKLKNQNISNGDFARRYLPDTNEIVAKILVNNVINSEQEEFVLSIPTSELGKGYHNFTARFDAYRGSFALFVDGIKVNEATFIPGQYTFSKTLDRPLIIGATSFYGSTLPRYISQPSFYATGCTLKNFVIYSEALDDSDINIIANSSINADMLVNIPAGQRSFVDEIERYFKLDVPSNKSSRAGIKINVGSISPELQALLESRIKSKLSQVLPVNTSIANIEWIS